jgi:hypothetical protein
VAIERAPATPAPGATSEPPRTARALDALGELLDGFQAAGVALDEPDQLREGLIAVVLRLVFMLHAEALGLLVPPATSPGSASVTETFDRLRADAALRPGALDARCGAWASLLELFRAVHGGAARVGGLFDPDRWPFLEGRFGGVGERAAPRITDGVVYRVLDRLLRVDGAPIAYGELDVEHLGRVYEGLMGFALERGPGRSRGLRLRATDERRRRGSHYTPRELTAPIVETALRPIVEDLGPAPTPQAILELRVCDPAMGSGAFLVEACRQLARALARAYEVHGRPAGMRPGEDLEAHARREVARRCVYGVDKDPFAVDLARLTIWLAAEARDLPLTFVDRSIRHGDALVGLSREQIAGFHWRPAAPIPALAGLVAAATPGETLDAARLLGDCVVASFFAEPRPRAREAALARSRDTALRWLGGRASAAELGRRAAELREGPGPIPAFHWEIELPEVFGAGLDAAGFDVIVGNPPFAGKNTMAASLRQGFPDWLKLIHEGAHGNADLVASFFCRAFLMLKRGGCMGLLATNTIGQGDTRDAGLGWIRRRSGVIYDARRRVRWPSPDAAVIVSVVHVRRGVGVRQPRLDGRPVERITAFLLSSGGDQPPRRLRENAGRSFQGPIVLGMGFTFDDRSDEATATQEMRALLARDARNALAIFPYIGGEEINNDPAQRPRRYVIDFGESSEREARERWPDLMAIVERKVRPARLAQRDRGARAAWWRFIRPRPALRAAIAGMERVLVIPFVGRWLAPVFIDAGTIVAGPANVIAHDSLAAFAVLQSRPHELWVRAFSSSLKDDVRYTPSDCFETFPFPEGWRSDRRLEAAGAACYDHRAAMMRRRGEGLTATYHRFHDPAETGGDVRALRALHAELDRAVLDAYGWPSIRPACEFLLDYEEPERATARAPDRERRRRKPWRLRWPDALRDEVLALLLELNAERAVAEARRYSTAQVGEQPSPASSFPSSQASTSARMKRTSSM